jgi:hypothetical protein
VDHHADSQPVRHSANTAPGCGTRRSHKSRFYTPILATEEWLWFYVHIELMIYFPAILSDVWLGYGLPGNSACESRRRPENIYEVSRPTPVTYITYMFYITVHLITTDNLTVI